MTLRHTLRQVFRSGKFVVGFVVFVTIVLTVLLYPRIIKDSPLAIFSRGNFLPPGIYVNLYDSVSSSPRYILLLDQAAQRRVDAKLGDEERQAIRKWLVGKGIPDSEIDVKDTTKLLQLWKNNFDPSVRVPGMTNADRNYYILLNQSLDGLLADSGAIVAATDQNTGVLQPKDTINQTDYVNIEEVPNVRWFPLGTDNFGRDVLTELVSAIGISLTIGFVAGLFATTIGLILGLVSGYLGGMVDDLIMFVTNLLTVIPTFILLILISYSIGQERRGAFTIAVVIGLTSWNWTTRSVRAQVISLRNRDHVNLSKLSGHSIAYILVNDILPYIASYVFMAFILQISSGILSEAGLSVIGLGPRTTEYATLGMMLNWALIYQAPVFGKWWAYVPVIIMIALISFSMNLMVTGLDQVFNPTLRE